MIGLGKQMHVGRLSRLFEHRDRLFGRGHRIVGAVQQEQRPGRYVADNVLGAEIIHRLWHLGGELLNRVLAQIGPQMFGDRHDVIAVDHQRFAGFFAMTAAFFQHPGEFQPSFLGRMLAAEFALAMAPAAGGNHAGNPLVDAAGIDRHRCTEGRPQHADTIRINLAAGLKIGQRRLRYLDLFLADHPAKIALALAATRHVETKCGIAPVVKHFDRAFYVARIAVAAKSMQHDDCRQVGVGRAAFRGVNRAGKRQLAACERNLVFHPDIP